MNTLSVAIFKLVNFYKELSLQMSFYFCFLFLKAYSF